MYNILGSAPSGESLLDLYEKYIHSNDRNIKVEVQIGNSDLIIGHTHISNISISYNLTEDSDFEMGIFTCAELSLTVKKSVTISEGTKLRVVSKLQVFDRFNNEIWVAVPIGVFYVNEVTNEYLSKTIKAYDRAFYFAKENLTLDNETGTTIGAIIDNINANENLTKKFGSPVITKSKVPNQEYPVYSTDLTSMSVREALGYIAGTIGGYVCMDEDDELKFFTLNDTLRTYTWDKFGAFEIQDYTRVISRLECSSTVKDSVTGEIFSDITINAGDGMDVYDFENPFITSETQLNTVFNDTSNKLNGLSYRPCSLKLQGDPRLRIGDFISVEAQEKANLDKWCDTTYTCNTHSLPIMRLTIKHNNGCMLEIEAVADKDRRRSLYRGGSIAEQLKALRKQVEKAINDTQNVKNEVDYARSDYNTLGERLSKMEDNTNNAVEGVQINKDTIEANIGRFDTIEAKIGDFEKLYVDKAYIEELYATKAYIEDAYIDKAEIKELYAEKAYIEEVYADKAYVDELYANVATIDEAYIANAVINNLTAEEADITQARIADAIIENAEIQEAVIGWAAIDEAEINKAVINYLDANQINADQIAANSIKAQHIDINQITTKHIQANAIKAGQIDADAITAREIAAGAVNAEEINAGAVTAEKIAAESISADKIQANAIESTHIKSETIETGHLVSNVISNGYLDSNAVSSDNIMAYAIVADKIATNAVISDKIMANAITAGKIDADAITSREISADAINAKHITGDAITAGWAKITNATIDGAIIRNIKALNMDIANVTAELIKAEEFRAAKISASNIEAGDLKLTDGITIKSNEDGSGGLIMNSERLQFIEPNNPAENPTYLGNVRVQLGKYNELMDGINENNYGLIIMGYKRDENSNLVFDEDGNPIYDWIFDSDRGLNVEMGIQSKSLTSDKIADEAITTDKIAVNAITADQLSTDAITSDHISASVIQVEHLQGKITFEALEGGDLEGFFFNDPNTDTTVINGNVIYTDTIYASDLNLKGHLTIYNDDNDVTFAVDNEGDVLLSGDISSKGDPNISIDSSGNGYFIKNTGESQFKDVVITDAAGSLLVGEKGFAGITSKYRTDDSGTVMWVGQEFNNRMNSPFRVSMAGNVSASTVDSTSIQSKSYVLKDAPNFRLDSNSGLIVNGAYGIDLNGRITASGFTIEDQDGNRVNMSEGRITNSAGMLINSANTNFTTEYSETGFAIKNHYINNTINVFTDTGGRLIFDKTRYLCPNYAAAHMYLRNYDFIFGGTRLIDGMDSNNRSEIQQEHSKNANMLVTGDVKAGSFSFMSRDTIKRSLGGTDNSRHERRIICEDGTINFY